MTLLIDSQLPIALVQFLMTLGWQAVHVSSVQLDKANDQTIWDYAKRRGMVIVTKDQDFAELAKQQASIPPQVMWVRPGNCRRRMLFDAFSRKSNSLLLQLAYGAPLVELS